jgi:hypothetical protein
MSVEGLTTILSRSPMPERVADNMNRSGELAQQGNMNSALKEAEERLRTVQATNKAEAARVVKEKKDKDDEEAKKRKQQQKKKQEGRLDLKA